jgi:thiol-disulfide isomerase/thioredoxin
MHPLFKKTFAITILLFTFCGIGLLFWYSEWKFSLPTPVPAQYHAIANGAHIDISQKINSKKNSPVFLHFFNPDCPCSRFNMPHFKELAATYGDRINFVVVVMTANKKNTAAAVKDKYQLTVPVLLDSAIAGACGVYSTPQAVLLSADEKLYYRGNYNRSRYCTDKKSNYAQMAIEALLASSKKPEFNSYALTAYGCSLPDKCTK